MRGIHICQCRVLIAFIFSSVPGMGDNTFPETQTYFVHNSLHIANFIITVTHHIQLMWSSFILRKMISFCTNQCLSDYNKKVSQC